MGTLSPRYEEVLCCTPKKLNHLFAITASIEGTVHILFTKLCYLEGTRFNQVEFSN